MLNSFSKIKKIKTIAVLLLLSGGCAAHAASAGCYKTPSAAAAAGIVGSQQPLLAESDGYRVTRIQSDPVLGRTWATIVSCGHPEWPAIAMALQEATAVQRPEQTYAKAAPVSVLVRAGEVVRLWRQESRLRIEVAGVSEESGGLGNLIKVRLLRTGRDDQASVEEFSGIVRGPFDVEMKP